MAIYHSTEVMYAVLLPLWDRENSAFFADNSGSCRQILMIFWQWDVSPAFDFGAELLTADPHWIAIQKEKSVLHTLGVCRVHLQLQWLVNLLRIMVITTV